MISLYRIVVHFIVLLRSVHVPSHQPYAVPDLVPALKPDLVPDLAPVRYNPGTRSNAGSG